MLRMSNIPRTMDNAQHNTRIMSQPLSQTFKESLKLISLVQMVKIKYWIMNYPIVSVLKHFSALSYKDSWELLTRVVHKNFHTSKAWIKFSTYHINKILWFCYKRYNNLWQCDWDLWKRTANQTGLRVWLFLKLSPIIFCVPVFVETASFSVMMSRHHLPVITSYMALIWNIHIKLKSNN
jgi:hypothetical protein